MKMKLNITFDTFSFRRPFIAATIQQCVEAVLAEEEVNVPCEINVLVTNDMGIQAINLASRNLDKPTDVLSFPMFEFTPGELPDSWEEYLDPETGLCPWKELLPRPRSLVTVCAGRLDILPYTPCCIFWVTTTWMTARKRPLCAARKN